MLALSPPLFSTNYGWPLEDITCQNQTQKSSEIFVEAEANSCLEFPYFDQIQNEFTPENPMFSGGVANSSCSNTKSTGMIKKLNHNASERERRKRVNGLYSFLRSLLPSSPEQKKKVSIPGTISQALKYIPELQKEVETLIQRKEKLLSSNVTRQEHIKIKQQGAKDEMGKAKSSAVSSVSFLGEKEVVIQLISSTDYMKENKEISFLPKLLEYLEEEEDGLLLLNATTFKCEGQNRLLNTVHLQVQGNHKIVTGRLQEKLSSFLDVQQSDITS